MFNGFYHQPGAHLVIFLWAYEASRASRGRESACRIVESLGEMSSSSQSLNFSLAYFRVQYLSCCIILKHFGTNRELNYFVVYNIIKHSKIVLTTRESMTFDSLGALEEVVCQQKSGSNH